MNVPDEVKSRLSIEDVAGRYVDLKRAGASLRGLCPFHQEKTPSFYVSPGRGTFHCFGCGRGGDIFTFLMEIERIPFPDAVQRLASQAGVEVPEREARTPSHASRLRETNEAAALIFRETLQGRGGERARLYLESRSFDERAMELFGLGYAPPGRDQLVQHLRGKGFGDRDLLDAGLAVQDEVGGKARDRFRGRLMFPIRDASGKISGFGGRALEEGQQPKYLNSPQTEIFDKSSVLFGINLAGDPIRRQRQAVLVEGYLDAVRAHVGGFTYTVASLGTAVTVQQLTLLARWTQRVVLALDPDPAGQAAAARAAVTALAEITRSRGRPTGGAGALELFIARLPDLRDPDELIAEEPAGWERAIAGAVPAFDFYFEGTLESLDRSSDGWRQEAIDRLLPLIGQFGTSAGWQAVWIERLARAVDVPVSALERTIGPGGGGRRRRETPPDKGARDIVAGTTSQAITGDPGAHVEEALLAMLLRLVVLPEEAAVLLNEVCFETPDRQAVLGALLAWRETGNFDYEMFRETLPESVREVADTLYAREAPLPDDGKVSLAVGFHLTRLEHFRVLAELNRVMGPVNDVPPEDKPAAMSSLAGLVQRRREVEERLEQLSRAMLRSPA